MVKEKNILTKEDVLRLDYEKKELIPLTFDSIFKGIFVKNLDFLKMFIMSQLDIPFKPDKCNIELLNNETLKENKEEYKKTVDVYVRINNLLYVNLEINREYFKTIKLRNLIFADKLYSTILKKGEHQKELSKRYFVQINLNAMEKTDTDDINFSYGEDTIILFGSKSKQPYTKNKYTLIKFLEYYRNLYYNDGEKLSQAEMWLVMLTSRNYTELYETLGYILDDEKRDNFIKEVIKMCSNEYIISKWEMDALDELVEQEKERIFKEEGINEGIKEGIKEGINQKQTEIVKNMLLKNMDISLISEITNLNEKEIIKIKRTL